MGTIFRGRSINTILAYNDRRTGGRGPKLVMGGR